MRARLAASEQALEAERVAHDETREKLQTAQNSIKLTTLQIEKFKVQLRLDALNLQNRSQFSDPDTNPFNSTFGKVPGQTNSVNRFYDIQLRIQF